VEFGILDAIATLLFRLLSLRIKPLFLTTTAFLATIISQVYIHTRPYPSPKFITFMECKADLWTFRHIDSSPPGHFAPSQSWSFRPLGDSRPRNGQFAPSSVIVKNLAQRRLFYNYIHRVRGKKRPRFFCITLTNEDIVS